MSDFKISKSMDDTFRMAFLKDRNYSILEFNERVLLMAENDTIPVIERLNFIKIVYSNLDEFISVRLSRSNENFQEMFLLYIQFLYNKMDKIYNSIVKAFNIVVSSNILNIKKNINKEIVENKLYYVYLNKLGDFNMIPLETTVDELKQILDLLYPSDKDHQAFLVRMISDKTFNYVFSGEGEITVERDISNMSGIKENKIFLYIQTTCKSEFLIKKFLNYFHLDIYGIINVPFNILNIENNLKSIKNNYKNPDYYFNPYSTKYEKIRYYSYLQNNNFLIRTPYESYNHILDFIDEMCLNKKIKIIFITLYRTAEDSQIIKSLIKASKSNKKVYVYIEPTARGNEELNLKMISALKDNENIHISCNYLGYKIHSKLFCAIDKKGIGFCHIGTGNYNEDTSKLYTDIHFLTSNQKYTKTIFEVFTCIFKKVEFESKMSHSFNNTNIFMAPYNLRITIMKMIEKEIDKKDKGKIYLKCNSLCDSQIINKLTAAASVGVDVKLIIRTSISIAPHEDIEIKSLVGRFLEHDRIYIFGDNVFISSADLLLRNIDKRVECLCKIESKEIKEKIINIFESL